MSELKLNPILVKMETELSGITKEYKTIMRSQYELFCNKMNNYGKNNILLGGDIDNEEDRKLAMMGIVIRMTDKVNRLRNLVLKNKENTVNESTIDTFQDIINYAIIAIIVNESKWK